jgi:hypothetical protein
VLGRLAEGRAEHTRRNPDDASDGLQRRVHAVAATQPHLTHAPPVRLTEGAPGDTREKVRGWRPRSIEDADGSAVIGINAASVWGHESMDESGLDRAPGGPHQTCASSHSRGHWRMTVADVSAAAEHRHGDIDPGALAGRRRHTRSPYDAVVGG